MAENIELDPDEEEQERKMEKRIHEISKINLDHCSDAEMWKLIEMMKDFEAEFSKPGYFSLQLHLIHN